MKNLKRGSRTHFSLLIMIQMNLFCYKQKRKAVHTYEYMGNWKKFNEISLPEKRNFIATEVKKST